MKKVRFYTTICLIVAMIVASCPVALASNAISYSLSWLFNPVEGVRGYVYAPSPHGFIVKDFENDTTALVNDKGAVIPSSSNNFTYVREDGIIGFNNYSEGSSGVMDVNGNSIIPAGIYDSVYVLGENRFACGNDGEDGYCIYGVMDSEQNTIIPAAYDYIRASGLIYCSNDETQDVYDYDGNLIAEYPYDVNSYISLLPVDDRYMIQTYDSSTESTSTKIVHINGTAIATIDGWVHPLSESVIYNVDYSTDDYIYSYYDLDGNFIGSESSDDAWEEGSLYESFTGNGNRSEYKIDYKNGREVLVDQSGTIIFDNPDNLSLWYTFDDRFIVIYKDGYVGLSDISGNIIVAPDYYDDISYCEEFDIFAFEKDLQISIAKITTDSNDTPAISVNVYGKPVEFDQPPIIKDGRTLVPVRAISEALGASVAWDEESQTVTATIGNTVVKLVINSNQMLVNGKEVEIDVPAEIINSRTLIPVRAISEAFGCQVLWESENYRVIID